MLTCVCWMCDAEEPPEPCCGQRKQIQHNKGVRSEEALQISSCGKGIAMRTRENSPVGLPRKLSMRSCCLCSSSLFMFLWTLRLTSKVCPVLFCFLHPKCIFFIHFLSIFLKLPPPIIYHHLSPGETTPHYLHRSQRHSVEIKISMPYSCLK